MDPLVSPEVGDRRLLRATQQFRFQPTFGQAARAMAAREFAFAPGPSIVRSAELAAAQDLSGADPRARRSQRQAGRERAPRLTEDEWRTGPHFREGLQYPDGGYTEAAAALIAERFDRRQEQDAIISRASQDFLTQAGLFMAGVGANVIDPVSIAASFVPIVGQMRYAALVARFGKSGGRAIKGAIEGFAGNVALEPIVFRAAREDQADYTMADSLVNIAFGTAFGAGLHVGVGAAGDAVARLRAPARDLAFRKAVADVVEGRQVDVDPVLRQDAQQSARLEAAQVSRAQTALGSLRQGGTAPAGIPARFPVSGVRDGAILSVEQIPAYVRDVIKAGVDESTIPRFVFDTLTVPAAVFDDLRVQRPSFGAARSRKVRISNEVLGKLYRNNPTIADDLLAELPGLLTSPAEVLPDHKNGLRALITRPFRLGEVDRKQRTSVAVMEVARTAKGLEITSLHISPDRTLKKARQLKIVGDANDEGSAGGTSLPHSAGPLSGTPAADDFPTVRATSTKDIGEPGSGINPDDADAADGLSRMVDEAGDEIDPLLDEQVEALRVQGRTTAEEEAELQAAIGELANLEDAEKVYSIAAMCLARGM